MGEILTPLQIWQSFDPAAEPLDTVLINTTQKGGITINQYYFTGRSIEQQKSRVYCVVASMDFSLPVLVIANEIEKSIDLDVVMLWAGRGYTVITIDYRGESGSGLHTVYPKKMSYAIYQKESCFYSVDMDVTKTPWYEYSVNTMRAITFAKSIGCTSKHINLLSIGSSAITGAQCLAVDKRIRKGCIAYGKLWYDVDENVDKEQKTNDEEQDNTEKWLMGIAPQSYLQFIEQPIYVVVGTNSTNTVLEDTAMVMPRLSNAKSRWLLIPMMLDTMTESLRQSIDNWFRATLSASIKQPRISIDSDEGRIFAKCADNAHVWYARGDKKSRLNWVTGIKEDDRVYLDIYDADTPVTVFANAESAGVMVSSELLEIVPSEYEKELVLTDYTRLIYNSSMGKSGFVPVDVSGDKPRWGGDVIFCEGPLGISGISGKKFGTFVLCENNIIRHFESVLVMDIHSQKKQDIEIVIIRNWFGESIKYTAKVSLTGGGMWQKVVLTGREFRAHNGRTLAEDRVKGLDFLAFCCKEEIIISGILFT